MKRIPKHDCPTQTRIARGRRVPAGGHREGRIRQRWLFADRPEDEATMGEMRKLVATVEDTFAALFPLWLSVYSHS